MAVLQVVLTYEPGWREMHGVFTVPDDDGRWEPIFDGPLPSSNPTSVLAWLVRLWIQMNQEA